MMSPMHHPRSSRVRIMDVAVAAGVSIGTVSNTLNHPERVTAETRERVMAAVMAVATRRDKELFEAKKRQDAELEKIQRRR